MRVVRSVIFGALLLAFMPTVGSAQDRRFHINFGGGPTIATGDLGERFATGWGPAIGVTLDSPNGRLGFQFEYAYRWFEVKDSAPISATRFSANHTTHQLDFNIVANLARPDSGVRPYIVMGPGMYYRSVEITEYVGSGIVCDPYWYVCGTYPISEILGSRGGWDFGFNVGGGVGFRIGEEAEFYVETRYHYVAGPEITPPAGLPGSATPSSVNSTGQYWPITFGMRF